MDSRMRMQAFVSLSLLLSVYGIAAKFVHSSSREPVMYKSTYSRSKEVQEKCSPYLSELSHSSPSTMDAEMRKSVILKQLTFVNGDWQQSSGNAPLMPFISSSSNASEDRLNNQKSQEEQEAVAGAVRLASLSITDVDLDPHKSMPSPHTINISAILQLGISSRFPLSLFGLPYYQGFRIHPSMGFSMLSIVMEGVYAELQNGQRLLCMVGSAELPSRSKNAHMPWDWLDSMKTHSANDSKILAVFHFPGTHSLTTRTVLGQLSSFHAPTDPSYFDPVSIFSQLGASSKYQFVSGDLVGSACASSQHFPGEIQPPSKPYQPNHSLCMLARELLADQWVDIMPNWNCTLSKDICIKLGPFTIKDSTSQLMDGGFNGIHLVVQDIQCSNYTEDDGPYSGNISAVLRAVLPSQSRHIALARTGLNGLTLAAEGKLSSSSGQICMVGCRGGDSSSKKEDDCESKICVYVTVSFSLRQRSILQGSISSIHNPSGNFYPLSFYQPLRQTFLPQDVLGKLTYEYTQIAEARAMWKKEQDGFKERIKKSMLKYPSANGNLWGLFEDLSVHSLAITNPDSWQRPHLKQNVIFDILAIENLVGVDRDQIYELSAMATTSAIGDEAKEVEQQNNYKVAAQLVIEDDSRKKDNSRKNMITVSAEGEYDPTVGTMFMVGCRVVNASWTTFHKSAELLEDGLDCRMEVRIQYPPTSKRWLIDPTVMVVVSSTRREEDPFFFPTIKLETFPIFYRWQREEIVSHRVLEEGLSILTLSLILGCVISQLVYANSHVDSTPYISIIMLAIQAVGFSIPLITGMESLFARRTLAEEGRVFWTPGITDSVLSEHRLTQVTGYVVKLLSLVGFLLTLRIVKKVIKSRIRLGTRRPLELWRVPKEKRVLAVCAAIHGIGFMAVWIIHSIRISQHAIKSPLYMEWRGDVHKQQDWERVLLKYYGMVQDLFLLPQVVGNQLWAVKGKPLRMLFYVGVTVLRLLPHVYDSVRSPLFNPDFNSYFADEYQYRFDFYSKSADIAILVVAVLLAIVVYSQQRLKGLKWQKVRKQGSEMYERLPSKTLNTEMAEAALAPETLEEGETV